MRTVKCIELDNGDFVGLQDRRDGQLTEEAATAVGDAKIVVWQGKIVKNRLGEIDEMVEFMAPGIV